MYENCVLRRNAIADVPDYRVVLTLPLCALGSRKICVTCFIAVFTLLTMDAKPQYFVETPVQQFPSYQ